MFFLVAIKQEIQLVHQLNQCLNYMKRVEAKASSGLSATVAITFNASRDFINFSIDAIVTVSRLSFSSSVAISSYFVPSSSLPSYYVCVCVKLEII